MTGLSAWAHHSLLHLQLLIQVIMIFVMAYIFILRLRILLSNNAVIFRLKVAETMVFESQRVFVGAFEIMKSGQIGVARMLTINHLCSRNELTCDHDWLDSLGRLHHRLLFSLLVWTWDRETSDTLLLGVLHLGLYLRPDMLLIGFFLYRKCLKHHRIWRFFILLGSLLSEPQDLAVLEWHYSLLSHIIFLLVLTTTACLGQVFV